MCFSQHTKLLKLCSFNLFLVEPSSPEPQLYHNALSRISQGIQKHYRHGVLLHDKALHDVCVEP